MFIFKLGFYLLSVIIIIIITDFGLIDSSLGIPESGRDISYSHKGSINLYPFILFYFLYRSCSLLIFSIIFFFLFFFII